MRLPRRRRRDRVNRRPCIRTIYLDEWEIQAALRNRKSQARAIIEPDPTGDLPHGSQNPGGTFDSYNGGPYWCWWATDNRISNQRPDAWCPYMVGDALVVREPWMTAVRDGAPTRADRVYYKSDGSKMPGWRPATTMPREFIRLVFRLVKIRAEFVQSITAEDALAEGLYQSPGGGSSAAPPRYGMGPEDAWETDPVDAFRRIWDFHRGRGSWAANRMVYVFELLPIQKPTGQSWSELKT